MAFVLSFLSHSCLFTTCINIRCVDIRVLVRIYISDLFYKTIFYSILSVYKLRRVGFGLSNVIKRTKKNMSRVHDWDTVNLHNHP